MNRTLARVAAELLDDLNLSAKTKKTYEGVLLPLVEKYGQTYIEEVQRSQIEEHLSSLIHVSYRTYNKHQTIITRLLNFAIERRYLTHNPISYLKRKKPDASLGEHDTDDQVRYFTKAELLALYTHVSRLPKLSALVALLHDSGAKISEVLALNLQNVNFSEREFRVVGKGNKKRWCYFGDRADKALKNYINGNREHPHEALFTERLVFGRNVRRLSYDTAYREWKAALGNYNLLQNARFHDLRHTFATERAKVVPLEVLRALLGHENIQTTLVYQKITSQVAKETALNALKSLQGL